MCCLQLSLVLRCGDDCAHPGCRSSPLSHYRDIACGLAFGCTWHQATAHHAHARPARHAHTPLGSAPSHTRVARRPAYPLHLECSSQSTTGAGLSTRCLTSLPGLMQIKGRLQLAGPGCTRFPFKAQGSKQWAYATIRVRRVRWAWWLLHLLCCTSYPACLTQSPGSCFAACLQAWCW